ncbi:MAG: sugar ABC transporter substrate-binding protein [Flexilinea sp.]
MKKLVAVLLVLVIAFSFCVLTVMAEDASVEGGVWGILAPNISRNTYYASCIKGVTNAIEENDPTATYVIAECDNDPAKQLDQMADMVQQGVKAIVAIPWGSSGLVAGVAEAKKAGIPVFLVDTPLNDLTNVASTIVSDNYSAGVIAGEGLVEALPDGGKIVTLMTTGSEAINQRSAGMHSIIDGTKITVAQDLVLNQGTVEEAMTQVENALLSIPDLKGIFTTGDVFADAAVSALKANGYKKGDIVIASVDGNAKGCELIADGWVYSTSAQQTVKMGYDSVVNALSYLGGKTIDDYIELPCLKVTADVLAAGEYEGF